MNLKVVLLAFAIIFSSTAFADETSSRRCLRSRTLICQPGFKPSSNGNRCFSCVRDLDYDQDSNRFNQSKCIAAKSVSRKMAKTYINESLYCSKDSDCSEINYAGGSICGSIMVNKVGKAGYELLKGDSIFKRMQKIIKDSGRYCGPMPRCARRPPGKVACVSNKCVYEIY